MNRVPTIFHTAVLVFASATTDAGDFTTSGRDILLDGNEFEVRGVAYQPAAIGENPSASFPFGDYFYTDANSTGIDEQYPLRWARDFANLGKMGANVIRVYGWDPNLDHSAFLSEAAGNGIYVLVNRFIDPNADFSDASGAPGYQPSTYVAGEAVAWTTIATEVGGNPAVMGFLIGNEANNAAPPGFWDAMNYIAGEVKAIAPDKLVSAAITDRLDQVDVYDGIVSNFDFWALQVYRGYSFGSFFSDYAARSTKPLVITEFGHDALDGRVDAEWPDDAAFAADAVEGLILELEADDAGADVASGAVVFEYADEWWKAGDPFTQTTAPTFGGPFLDGEFNEEWWGIFRAVDNGGGIDQLEPRALFYRLAALWNEPYPVAVDTAVVGGELRMKLAYPLHLRDQQLRIEASGDLASWVDIASDSGSGYPYPVPAVSSAALRSIEAGEQIHTTVLYDIQGAPATAAVNLLANGDFETGTPIAWSTFGSVTSGYAEGGSGFSLRLSGGGGFSVPVAFQERSAGPGDEFNLSGWMLTPESLPADGTVGLLKIVFVDSGGNELQPASITVGTANTDFPGAESIPLLTESSPAETWQFTEVQAVAPAGTAAVVFFALNVDESAATLHFDSLAAVDVDGPLLVPGPAGSPLFFRFTNSGR